MNKKQKIKKTKGFSLIELMIVVGIVAIIAAVALPSYQSSVRKTHRGDGKIFLTRLESQFQLHRLRYGKFPTTVLTSGTASVTDIVVDLESPEKYYAIDVPNGTFTETSFNAVVTPQGAQANDTCQTLTINYLGVKGPPECW